MSILSLVWHDSFWNYFETRRAAVLGGRWSAGHRGNKHSDDLFDSVYSCRLYFSNINSHSSYYFFLNITR